MTNTALWAAIIAVIWLGLSAIGVFFHAFLIWAMRR